MLLFSLGCSLYKSPDRKDFESVFGSLSAGKLNPLSCSDRSIASANAVIGSFSQSGSSETLLIRKVKTDSGPVLLESDNLQGTYCVYRQL
jgi:hypothetical protein